MRWLVCAYILLCLPNPAKAEGFKIIRPLPNEIAGDLQVVSIKLTIGVDATKSVNKLDVRAASKLGSNKFKGQIEGSRNGKASTLTMPFAEMFSVVLDRTLQEARHTSGTKVNLNITLDEVKVLNISDVLTGSRTERMSGLVEVEDNATRTPLAMFFVKIIKPFAGLAVMAARGESASEGLVRRFAQQVSVALAARRVEDSRNN